MSVEIQEAVRSRFEQFINKYQRAFPHYIEARYSKKLNLWVSIVQMALFLVGGIVGSLVLLIKPKKKLYFFEGGRFSELHALLPADQVVIIGGLRELRYCKQHGYGFHWDGYIRKLFNIFYFLKINMAMSILIFMVRNLIGRQLGNTGRLFLFEDTVQIGCSLALILKDITPVICIAHGTISKEQAGFDLVADGGVCSFNFVYDEYQRRTLERLGSICFKMGLPYEIPELLGWSEEVVLIEQSTPDMPEEYEFWLPLMVNLYGFLRKSGYSVIYRARPGVDTRTLIDKFDVVHSGDKMSLLSGARKIFIGSNSTLLYEAKIAGHVTIGLDDSRFPYVREYLTDFEIFEFAEEAVNIILTEAFLMLKSREKVKNQPLCDRFYDCINQLEGHIIRTSGPSLAN